MINFLFTTYLFICIYTLFTMWMITYGLEEEIDEIRNQIDTTYTNRFIIYVTIVFSVIPILNVVILYKNLKSLVETEVHNIKYTFTKWILNN